MARDKFRYAGQCVKIRNNVKELGGMTIEIEDYWENVYGKSWMFADGNPAALRYAIRCSVTRLPIDNEVVYGKIGGLGYLVHVSELDI